MFFHFNGKFSFTLSGSRKFTDRFPTGLHRHYCGEFRRSFWFEDRSHAKYDWKRSPAKGFPDLSDGVNPFISTGLSM
jgi:hypothetical protein